MVGSHNTDVDPNVVGALFSNAYAYPRVAVPPVNVTTASKTKSQAGVPDVDITKEARVPVPFFMRMVKVVATAAIIMFAWPLNRSVNPAAVLLAAYVLEPSMVAPVNQLVSVVELLRVVPLTV
jgi:hypothetical protein